MTRAASSRRVDSVPAAAKHPTSRAHTELSSTTGNALAPAGDLAFSRAMQSEPAHSSTTSIGSRTACSPGAGLPRAATSESLTTPDGASDGYYAFANFQLYPTQRTLLHDGRLVEIGGRAFDTLLLLVLRAGTVVSAKDLMSFVWPNFVVEAANLRVQIGIVRKVLSRCGHAQRAIENIPLRGYCFILPVRHVAKDPQPAAPRGCQDVILPPIMTPIIGRQADIETIMSALECQRLVTITGPGGIGKTTVAIAAARQFAGHLPRPIIFVDLSQVTDADGATCAIAIALGCSPSSDMRMRVFEHLRSGDSLLFLDTCEHIVELIALLVEELLYACPTLKLLVTSREALRAAGEWHHRLPSLTYPEEGEKVSTENLSTFTAVHLFVDKLHWNTKFYPPEQDLERIAEICRRLDGNPLALELAAARVTDLGLCRLVEQLDRRFQLLTRGRRTAAPRLRTLAAMLDWSYQMLSEDERLMLRHLVELPSAFTPEDAVCSAQSAGCQAPLDALTGLYAKSLIDVRIKDGTPVYYLLDTTRCYVRTIMNDQNSRSRVDAVQ